MSHDGPQGHQGTHRHLRKRVRRDLDRLTGEGQRTWKSPGVSAAVVVDGRLAWSAHVGAASLDSSRPATDDTQYLIGSVTKTFTAILVMALRDEGKLRLDDELGTFVPGTKHGGLRIRQLLSHASGLQREPVGRIWESLQAPDQERLLRELEQAEQVLPAHTAFHYSNLAYALLGQVVERLDGRSWGDSVTTRILQPLAMVSTGLVPDPAKAATGYLVHPHSATVTKEPHFELNATAPLGGLWSTVADLSRYAAFVADPVEEVLKPDTLDEMVQPVIMTDPDSWTGAYGLGFSSLRDGERVYVGHGGAMPGYLTGLLVCRAEKVGAVAFANSTAGADTPMLALKLARAVIDGIPAAAKAWTPSAAQPQLDGMLGSWWTEGEEVVLEVRDNQLWARLPAMPLTRLETRFEPEGDDLYRAVQGRERGERLEVIRDAEGAVVKLYFATYPMTRTPAALADLAAASRGSESNVGGQA